MFTYFLIFLCYQILHFEYPSFQAERLADYGRLLGRSQPALDGRQRDLDRIQDLFPHDYLGLHIPEPNSTYTIVSLIKTFLKCD